MSSITKPMLAGKLEGEMEAKFPAYATPKLDGIRCLIINGKAVTRKFKPVPNKHIREMLEKFCVDGMDGELMCPGEDFNTVQSKVMSQDGTPDFEYHVFDYVKDDLSKPYLERMADLSQLSHKAPFIKLVLPVMISDINILLHTEREYLRQGYEGIMLRTPDSPYKCGRSTVKEGYLVKLKRFTDSEARIVGFKQFNHNVNELEEDAFGYAKRSSKKEGKIPQEMVGSFIVEDVSSGTGFDVGSGLTLEERKKFWTIQDTLLGKIVKYKYQELGVDGKPRFPVFLGFRDERDMS